MSEQKDIRFAEKKVDDSWKERMGRDKGKEESSGTQKTPPAVSESLQPFLNLMTSLGYQAMIHLGEIPHPETKQITPNLDAAKEIIDLLIALKVKTESRLGPEEAELFNSVLPELQMKFAQKI